HDARAAAMAEALRAAREIDVRIYPVASSGIDEFTELSMRSAAQFTGGRYIFLTDDSGVGGAHKEPSIPCYFVTRLDHAIHRMVRIELSGEYSEPTESEILRTSGNPDKGSCKLASGVTVEIF
ncbi:MAG TPA: VWA domain-containing protein, partial [Polyangiales bacterium]|nr:VWA domain-containing protein [Polyangiales bacterium]